MDRSEAGKLGAQVTKEKAAAQRILLLEEYYRNPKLCKNCGKPIEVPEGKCPSYLRYKTFCNSSCSASYSNVRRAQKAKSYGACLNCGKPRSRSSSAYCCFSCQHAHKQEQYISRWKDGLEDGMSGLYGLSGRIRRYIREKYNGACASCGCDKKNPFTQNSIMEIHHIDGNHKNNAETNLVLLCPNCHAMTDTYKCIGGRVGRAKGK